MIADVLGIDIGETEVQVAVVSACMAIVLAVLGAIGSQISGARERRRELYGNAYRKAMEWREMLYRVRRRADDHDADRALVERFHQLQEEIDYYRGWIGSESKYMARSYCALVRKVKAASEALIQEAWNEAVRRPPAQRTLPDEMHPDTEGASNAFLKDVRAHLALWLLPRIAVAYRNRNESET